MSVAKFIYVRTKSAGDVRVTPILHPNRGIFAIPEPEDRIRGVEVDFLRPATDAQRSAVIDELLRHFAGGKYEQWHKLERYIDLTQ